MNLKEFEKQKPKNFLGLQQSDRVTKKKVDYLPGSALYMLKSCDNKNNKVWEERFRNNVQADFVWLCLFK